MHSYDSFRAARWIRFINLVLQAGLFLTLFLGLNFLALNHSWRFDLTQSRRHSLSAETRSYLEQLDRDVRIIVTIPKENTEEELNQAFHDISGLLTEYTYLSRNHAKGKIEVRYLDVYQNRKDTEALGLDTPNQVVLISDDHRRVLSLADFYQTRKSRREGFRGEATLTAALLDVSSPEKKKIYFLAGHEEMRPEDVDRRRGLSGIRDELRARNYEVASLDLNLSHKIPDDAALIIVAGPKGRLLPFEEELFRNYLTTRAGRLILLLNQGYAHGLENLLFDWGIIVQDDLIIDLHPDSITESNDMRLWRFSQDSSHITDNLINNGMSLTVGACRTVMDDAGRSLDDGLRVKKLIATSPLAWGEKSYRIRNKLPEYTPGQDMKGELGVMVISERLKPANLPLSVKGGRLAVVGTADLVTNDRIITVGNLNLFIATVGWAIQDKDILVNIPVRPIERFQLALSADEFDRLRLGLLLVVPGIVALLGIGVYWTRRN